jgi:hypothetical protein
MQAIRCKWLASKLREVGTGMRLFSWQGEWCGRKCRAFIGRGNALPVLRRGSLVVRHHLSPFAISRMACHIVYGIESQQRKTGGF